MSIRRAALSGSILLALSVNVPSYAQPDDAPAIRLSQIGLEAGGPGTAVLVSDNADPLAWRLLDADGGTVAEGQTEPFGPDEASGQSVHRIALPGSLAPGKDYRIEAGGAQSRAFAVTEQPWSNFARDAVSLFSQNRAGIAIAEDQVERPDLSRPAAHEDEVLTCFSGADMNGNAWPGCDHERDTTGGWYDAGDHGKYVVNGGIAVWTLFDAAERFGEVYTDGALPVPEAGNGVNDLLDEARWGMDFLLSMQIPDGARMTIPVGPDQDPQALSFTEIDAGGMAHHKTHDEYWTPLPQAPHESDAQRFLYPPSTAATLNLAAAAAHCARVFADIDPDYAERCLDAAERAWSAAGRNPHVYAPNVFEGGGGYGDEDVSDEVYWAAAELYAATGETRYADALRASPHFLQTPGGDGPTGHIAWPSVGTLGTITLATAPTDPDPADLDAADIDTARDNLVAAADRYLEVRDSEGYAIPLGPDGYTWGSNGDILNRAMVLAHAASITGEARYRQGAVDAMDYVLGRNALDQSFVTGYGARPMENPHHRFWAHQADPGFPRPPSGVISGGPNNQAMTDPVAAEMEGRCAPQTCWADHIDSYAMNEVAINWNAPLVWVAAYLNQTGSD